MSSARPHPALSQPEAWPPYQHICRRAEPRLQDTTCVLSDRRGTQNDDISQRISARPRLALQDVATNYNRPVRPRPRSGGGRGRGNPPTDLSVPAGAERMGQREHAGTRGGRSDPLAKMGRARLAVTDAAMEPDRRLGPEASATPKRPSSGTDTVCRFTTANRLARIRTGTADSRGKGAPSRAGLAAFGRAPPRNLRHRPKRTE